MRELTARQDDSFNQLLFDADTVQRLLSLLRKYGREGDTTNCMLALRVLGDMMASAEAKEGVEAFISNGGLADLQNLLLSERADICRTALWVLSNLACDSALAAEKIVKSAAFTTAIEKLHGNCEISREAFFAVGYALN